MPADPKPAPTAADRATRAPEFAVTMIAELRAELKWLQAENARLRASIVILETPPCFACGAKVTEPCRRPPDKLCGREHEGGSRQAKAHPR